MHLLGNLLFFYLVGPLLEDVWGRPLFAGFYLVGGLFAAVAQFALDPSSRAELMAGASGAAARVHGLSACATPDIACASATSSGWSASGAASSRMPAWAWAGLWFARQRGEGLLPRGHQHRRGGDGPSAASPSASGWPRCCAPRRVEERFLAPELAKRQGVWTEDPLLTQAEAALDQR